LNTNKELKPNHRYCLAEETIDKIKSSLEKGELMPHDQLAVWTELPGVYLENKEVYKEFADWYADKNI
jgi:hypothetical protein